MIKYGIVMIATIIFFSMFQVIADSVGYVESKMEDRKWGDNGRYCERVIEFRQPLNSTHDHLYKTNPCHL